MGRAQEAPAPFQNGQTVVFAGDSITHGCMYPYYVQLFYATRFPDREITFLNAGVNGDTAAGCLMRLDGDILAVKPDQVYMMFSPMWHIGRGAETEFSVRNEGSARQTVEKACPPEAGEDGGACRDAEHQMAHDFCRT